MGRPLTVIDWEKFDSLCALQCTLEEIADFHKCTIDTIENRVRKEKGMSFSEYFAQKRGTGRRSLRRKQYEIAMAGNPTMLIWLGKNWLEQTDKTDVTSAGSKIANGIEITVIHKNAETES